MTSIIQGRDSWKVRSRLRNNGVLLEEWDGDHRSLSLFLRLFLSTSPATDPKIREIPSNICKGEKVGIWEIAVLSVDVK